MQDGPALGLVGLGAVICNTTVGKSLMPKSN